MAPVTHYEDSQWTTNLWGFNGVFYNKIVKQTSTLDYSTLDDGALLALIAGKHGALSSDPVLSAAIGALYDRYGRLVYTIAFKVVKDGPTAEEITQDVFVKAWDGAHTYRPEMAKVSSWLVSITRHRAIDELRRRKVRPEKDRMDWPDGVEMEDLNLIPTTDGPEKTAETNLEQQAIRQAVAALPADQRQALGLAFFSGLSHSQIAALLNEPLGTVKSRIQLAMRKLHDSLNGEHSDG